MKETISMRELSCLRNAGAPTRYCRIWRCVCVLLTCLIFSAAKAQTTNYALGTTTLIEGPAAGGDSVVLTVRPATGTWTVTSDADWLQVYAGNLSGTNSDDVMFNFDANPGPTRSGHLAIGDQILTVTQAGSAYEPEDFLTTLASSGLALPHALAVDGADNVYIADTGNNAIKEWVAATGAVITLVSAGVASPSGVAVDGSGNVYISDSGHQALDEWTPANSNLVVLAQGDYVCSAPALAVDLAGNLYFNDTCNDTFKEWWAANSNLTILGSGAFYTPAGVAVDKSGVPYVADGTTIFEMSLFTGYYAPVLSGLGSPQGVAVDGQRNIYFADAGSNTVEGFLHFLVDWTPKVEGLGAGVDSLPAVLPAPITTQHLAAPASNQPWLTITGVTNGVISFAFSAATTTRTGLISWLGINFPVTQLGPSESIGITSLLEGPEGGADSVILSLYPSSSPWTATANAPWLHLSAPNQSGTGSATVVFSFDTNAASVRTGTLTIAGETVTVTQAAGNYVAAGSVA